MPIANFVKFLNRRQNPVLEIKKSLNINKAVLRIRDVYLESWILIFNHSESRIQKQKTGGGGGLLFVATNFTKQKTWKKPFPEPGSATLG
jgi:hypothetical protein